MNEQKMSPTVIRPIDKVKQEYKKIVIPKQKEKLDKVTVASFKDKAGTRLAEAIQDSFSRENKYSSEVNKRTGIAITRKLNSVIYSASDIREVTIKNEKGKDENLLIVRDNLLGKELTRTHVLIVDPELKDKATPQALRYKNLFYTGQDGLTADLMDLVSSDTEVYFSISNNPGMTYKGTDLFTQHQFISIDEEGLLHILNRQLIPHTALHEAGHSLQFYSSPLFKRLNNFIADFIVHHLNFLKPNPQHIANRVVEERNANAFALAVLRRYKLIGLNLIPGLSNEDLIKTVNKILSHYDKIFKTKDVTFNHDGRFANAKQEKSNFLI